MRFCLLAIFFPLNSMVVQEQRPMVLLNLLRAGRVWIFELILNELEVNGRNDALGVQLRCRGVHFSFAGRVRLPAMRIFGALFTRFWFRTGIRLGLLRCWVIVRLVVLLIELFLIS